MAAYATVADVQSRLTWTMNASQQSVCSVLLDDAATIIDALVNEPDAAAAKTVSCRMVMRALGDGSDNGVPMGATQGSMSGLGYSQSWTMGTGSTGELYVNKLEKQLLGIGDRIGSYSPVQELVGGVEV